MIRRLATVEKKAWADKAKIKAGEDPEEVADEKDEDGSTEPASVAYRYRKFTLGKQTDSQSVSQ